MSGPSPLRRRPAYDPVRKSLILYGGQSNQMTGMYYQTVFGDTWEWSSTTRQ